MDILNLKTLNQYEHTLLVDVLQFQLPQLDVFPNHIPLFQECANFVWANPFKSDIISCRASNCEYITWLVELQSQVQRYRLYTQPPPYKRFKKQNDMDWQPLNEFMPMSPEVPPPTPVSMSILPLSPTLISPPISLPQDELVCALYG